MTRTPAIDAETILAAIREHGPISKTQLMMRLRGTEMSPRMERLLDQLRDEKRVIVSPGISKGSVRNQRTWVYSVAK